jgi:arabinogalactan endo-1,4-beta-galactosidase
MTPKPRLPLPSLFGCLGLSLSLTIAACGSGSGGETTGTAGTSGSAGTTGTGGNSGVSGNAGTTGAGGTSAGTAGTTGAGGSTAGASGSAGTTGSAGTGGATGAGGTGGTTAGAGGASAGRGGTGGAAGRGGSGGGSAGAGGGGAGRGGAGGSTGGAAGRGGTGGSSAGTGGSAAGTTGTGGTGTTTLPFSYYIGADVTDQETQSNTTRATLLSIMQSHGFNYIRLRTFVDPKAADGYDQTNGYDDITHTASFGKQVKDAGMGLLLDFHYSDNWADPGKQCVPVAWQSYTTIAQLASAVHDYTKASIQTMIAGGARPDMVQIGNEITPGMLIHVCDSGGQPTGNNQVTGAISNWTNLGMLLKAGVAGVKEVDSGIVIAMHLDRGNDLTSSRNFINNATTQGVQFDVFGESCYTAYQGQPSAWMNTFTMLASMFPNMKFMIAEYGPEQKAANDMIFGLPNNRGVGTFNWEPTTQGAWNTGHDLLRRSGTTYTVQPDMALYDQMKIDYASRL